jgi:hypothetical protein
MKLPMREFEMILASEGEFKSDLQYSAGENCRVFLWRWALDKRRIYQWNRPEFGPGRQVGKIAILLLEYP